MGRNLRFIVRRPLRKHGCIFSIEREEGIAELTVLQLAILIAIKYSQKCLDNLQTHHLVKYLLECLLDLLCCYVVFSHKAKHSESIDQVELHSFSQSHLCSLQFLPAALRNN